MIITVTANAMVEHIFHMPTLTPGKAHHPDKYWLFATGKGLNVARALRDLGADVTAVVAVAGVRGRQIQQLVAAESIPFKAVNVRGESRVGFVAFDRGQVTTVYGPGPSLGYADVDAIVDAVRELLPARLLVLAGSVTHPNLYRRLSALNVPVVLDFAHPSFEEILRIGDVHLAKPNRQEARMLLGEDDPIRAARRITSLGARWGVVTDGGGPALFSHGDRLWQVTPPIVPPAHPVGCGDALCAGLIFAMDRPPERAIAFAMACGAHNASRPEIACLDRRECESLAEAIHPEPLWDY